MTRNSDRLVNETFTEFHLDINECSSSPCRNGATCLDLVNKYECQCVAGYTGTNCEQGLASTITKCSSFKGYLLLLSKESAPKFAAV